MTRATSRSAAGGLLYRVARLAYQQLVFLKVVVRIHKVFRRLSHDDRFSVDPHPIKLYEMLLDRLHQQGAVFVTASECLARPRRDDACTVLLRQDVDFDPFGLHLLIDVQRRKGLKSTVYVLMDETQYDLQPHVEYLLALRDDGFELGLHSICYAAEQPVDALREECEKYRSIFGRHPDTFTFHGMVYRTTEQLERRSYLRRNQEVLVKDLPFALRLLDVDFDKRLSDAFTGVIDPTLPPGFWTLDVTLGCSLQVLTHPIHWVRAKL